MKFLVTMEQVVSPTPQEFVQFVEQVIIPNHEACVKLEAEGKILAGGWMAGTRDCGFVVEAASSEEVAQLLTSLRLWSMMKVKVAPLESFEHRLAMTRQVLERVKAARK